MESLSDVTLCRQTALGVLAALSDVILCRQTALGVLAAYCWSHGMRKTV